jgi:hypothetical protein
VNSAKDPDGSGRRRRSGPSVSRRTALAAGAGGLASLWLNLPSAGSARADGPNAIQTENALPGTDAWRITSTPSDDAARQIKGYASATSVNKGEAITFYVTVNPIQFYSLDVYRIGYYQGLGGRLMLHDTAFGVQQRDPSVDPATGMVSCSWGASYQLTIPSDWASGIYLVKLTNSRQYQSYITFVVRDDASTSALLYQQAVTTYQAYNNFPNDVSGQNAVPATGKSLYDFNSSTSATGVGTTRAVKVSFDRPYASNGDGAGDFLSWELYFVRWLEQSGYDVTYCTDIDTHVASSRLLNHRGFLSVGHDEYWSAQMYDGVSNALANGVGLGFFGANAVYWQMRLEANAAGVANRVQVCYKDASKDPQSGTQSTVNWRNVIVNRPEQQLLGSMFVAQQPSGSAPASHVVKNSSHWTYAGTGVADGDAVPNIIGYECDKSFPDVALPTAVPGTYTVLSDSQFTTAGTTNEGGSGAPTEHANTIVYQAASGAWVFNAGSIEWSWGLYNFGSRNFADTRIQKMTANVLDRLCLGPAAIPSAATGITATPAGGNAISLAWTDGRGTQTAVIVDRSTSPSFANPMSVNLAPHTTSWTDTGLAPGAYWYRVRAVNDNGSSIYSDVAAASTVSHDDLVQGTASLRNHWRLGERVGGVAIDAKGTADGAYVNGVTLGLAGAIARDSDTAAGFNGSTQKINLPSLPSVGDFSVVGWSYLTAANANSALYGTNNNVRILVRPGAGPSVYAGVWLNGTEYVLQPAGAASNLNVWVQWALTRTGSILTLYRNGVQMAQRTDLPASASANISGWIGAQGGSAYYFPGRIDDVALYATGLSADAVAATYVAATNGLPPSSGAHPAYRDLVLSESSLLGYWRLGETSGTVAVDAKNGANGTYQNNVALGAAGALANDTDAAASFNGTTNKVSLPNLAAVTDFTFEGWTYLTANAVNNSNGNNTLWGTNNNMRMLVRPGAGNTSSDILAGVWLNGTEYTIQPTSTQSNLNTWVHWAFVRSGSSLVLYRNGTQVGQRSDLPAAATANLSGWIGAQGGTAYYLNGRIDEIAIYTSALRPATVSAHVNAALTGSPPAAQPNH